MEGSRQLPQSLAVSACSFRPPPRSRHGTQEPGRPGAAKGVMCKARLAGWWLSELRVTQTLCPWGGSFLLPIPLPPEGLLTLPAQLCQGQKAAGCG